MRRRGRRRGRLTSALRADGRRATAERARESAEAVEARQAQLGLGASYRAADGRQDASAVLKQAYVRARGVFGGARSSLRAGRFEFVEGLETTPKNATLAALKRERIAQRLAGSFGFSHVGRATRRRREHPSDERRRPLHRRGADDARDVRRAGVRQFGGSGNQTYRAGALALEGGFRPGGALSKVKTWVRAGYFRSTGDGDPADRRHTTFFQVLPTPRVYARSPFYNLMNNEDVFAQLQMRPHARRLRLSNANDLWYAGGGANPTARLLYAELTRRF